MRLARLAIALVALALVAGPALGQDDGDDFQDASPSSPSLQGRSSSMDDLDGRPASLDDSLGGGATDLDELDSRGSQTIEQVRRGNTRWTPPPCDPLAPTDAKLPEGADGAAWDTALKGAEGRLQSSEKAWRDLETGAVVGKPEPGSEETRAEATARALGQARDAYAGARCDLLSMLERARRAGVPAGTLVPHIESLPADLANQAL